MRVTVKVIWPPSVALALAKPGHRHRCVVVGDGALAEPAVSHRGAPEVALNCRRPETPVASLLMEALQPPLKDTVPSQVAKAASIAVWSWQAASVAGIGQVRVTAGAAVTVKVSLHTTSASQSLLTVQVTVVEPPQAGGAVVASLLMEALQPPLKDTVPSQVAKAASIAVWSWQAASVAGIGQWVTRLSTRHREGLAAHHVGFAVAANRPGNRRRTAAGRRRRGGVVADGGIAAAAEGHRAQPVAKAASYCVWFWKPLRGGHRTGGVAQVRPSTVKVRCTPRRLRSRC
ncbi:MAG: hypothetical protein IPN22_15790 [Bacteroidetes bacterium]|nr:hypothetical protein [Bacteroidota bacterium]